MVWGQSVCLDLLAYVWEGKGHFEILDQVGSEIHLEYQCVPFLYTPTKDGKDRQGGMPFVEVSAKGRGIKTAFTKDTDNS